MGNDMKLKNRKHFTEHEIQNWGRFEKVRASGLYNMFDPRARELTGLSIGEYGFTMDNFSDLKEAAGRNA